MISMSLDSGFRRNDEPCFRPASAFPSFPRSCVGMQTLFLSATARPAWECRGDDAREVERVTRTSLAVRARSARGGSEDKLRSRGGLRRPSCPYGPGQRVVRATPEKLSGDHRFDGRLPSGQQPVPPHPRRVSAHAPAREAERSALAAAAPRNAGRCRSTIQSRAAAWGCGGHSSPLSCKTSFVAS